MITLKIKVTKDILEKSKMCRYKTSEWVSTNCAVALAVRDIFPKAIVGTYQISINVGGRFIPIDLPLNVQEYISDFDHALPERRPLLPEIEFEITVCDEIVEQINIEELKPLLINHPTLEIIA